MAYYVKGMQHLMGKLGRVNFAKSIESSCEAIKEDMIEDMQNNILTAKPREAFDTGRLYESCDGSVIATSDLVVVEVTNKAPYAKYVEFGTGPKGKASPHPLGGSYRDDGWVYKSEKDGEFHYTEGMPARPFMYPTFKKYEEEITKRIGADLRTDLGRGDIYHGKR